MKFALLVALVMIASGCCCCQKPIRDAAVPMEQRNCFATMSPDDVRCQLGQGTLPIDPGMSRVVPWFPLPVCKGDICAPYGEGICPADLAARGMCDRSTNN